MGFSFYTVYAVRSLGMSEIAVGILTGVLLGTAIIANPVMGWIGDQWSHRLLMAIGVLGASASALIAWLAPSPIWFVPVFMLAGIANVAVWTISLAMIPDFSSEADRPSYIGLANTLIAPVTILAPLLGGWLAASRRLPNCLHCLGDWWSTHILDPGYICERSSPGNRCLNTEIVWR